MYNKLQSVKELPTLIDYPPQVCLAPDGLSVSINALNAHVRILTERLSMENRLVVETRTDMFRRFAECNERLAGVEKKYCGESDVPIESASGRCNIKGDTLRNEGFSQEVQGKLMDELVSTSMDLEKAVELLKRAHIWLVEMNVVPLTQDIDEFIAEMKEAANEPLPHL
jgi:hypothetical protein